jgi:hypothetical protein
VPCHYFSQEQPSLWTPPYSRDYTTPSSQQRRKYSPAAYAFAQELAQNTSQTAIAVTKALVWHAADTIEEQHIIDSRAIRSLGAAADGAEGTKAFKEKRAIKFPDTLSKNLPSWVPWVCIYSYSLKLKR